MKPGVGPPKHKVPCDCTGQTPTKPALVTLPFQLVSEAAGASSSASYSAKSPWQVVENWAGNTFQHICL